MNLVELRVLALYERLWRENRLLLGLMRAGLTLAEAEVWLAKRAQGEGERMNRPSPSRRPGSRHPKP